MNDSVMTEVEALRVIRWWAQTNSGVTTHSREPELTMTDDQLDGTACVRCGDKFAPMRPLPEWGPRGQVFECTSHGNGSTT